MSKIEWFGVVGVILAYRQCHHSIERIRFPIGLLSKLYVYLVPFMRYSLRLVKNIPLLRLTHPMEGFPWDDLRKILQ